MAQRSRSACTQAKRASDVNGAGVDGPLAVLVLAVGGAKQDNGRLHALAKASARVLGSVHVLLLLISQSARSQNAEHGDELQKASATIVNAPQPLGTAGAATAGGGAGGAAANVAVELHGVVLSRSTA